MRHTEFFVERHTFHDLTASVLMEREVATCRPTDSGRQIASRLTQFGSQFGSLPVVDEHRTLVGLISEFDLLKAIREGRNLGAVRAEEIMSRNLKVVEQHTPVDEIVRLMETHHLIRVPVVKDGKLVGVVARRDVLFGYLKCTDTYWSPAQAEA